MTRTRKTPSTATTTTTGTKTKVSTVKKALTKEELINNIRISLKCKNETQKKLMTIIKENDVTICSGPAGTGKTLISIYEALLLLKNNPTLYKEIKLVKSITQLKNEEIGTLPGDEMDKLKFHMMSFLDAFHKLIGEELTNLLIEFGIIKMEVFGAIRGRSFTNSIIIIDEFQNISKDNGKTFLTRFSENTKVIVLGDSGQIDLKDKRLSALEPLVNNVLKNPEEGVGIVKFDKSEVVRHRLTTYFINIFDNIQKDDEPKPKVDQTKVIKIKPRYIKEGGKKINWLRKIKIFFKRRFN
jgi:phosphate starvation-inducible PhoH-like protein